MNILDAQKKINLVKDLLLEIGEISKKAIGPIEKEMRARGEEYLWTGDMEKINPKANIKLHKCWEGIQKSVPAGFDIDGNLIRHLSFNQAQDWNDIFQNDIPRELNKIDAYKKQLTLVEYIGILHPEVSRVTEIVLNGDIDAALKTIFASLDAKIRGIIKAKPSESTVPAIGKAFKDGVLSATHKENSDSVRNFLQGVLGYYRSVIIHNPLPLHRNNVEASLSLFGLAHETFVLLDSCSKAK